MDIDGYFIYNTSPTLGVGKFKEAQLTAILSPVVTYHSGDRLCLSKFAETTSELGQNKPSQKLDKEETVTGIRYKT
ncbi:hypothetical protein ACTXT7_007588 [Hymenolepis weldensis]